MADPKYENLPGIAYDQPDVYECGDLPEADQPDPYEEEENECIEQLSISVKDSYNKFKGKFLTGNVDFSDTIGRRKRTGYQAGEWVLAAEGEVETPLERYNRLKCELAELCDLIAESQNQAPDSEQEEYKVIAAEIHNTKALLDELKLHVGRQADTNTEKLKQHLLKSKDASGALVSTKIKLITDKDIEQTTRLAQLEHRLHHLEQIAGVRDDEMLKKLQALTGEATLCSAAASIASKSQLLRPNEIAAAEGRIASLLANVDALKASISPANPETEAKVDALYKLLKQIEGVSHSEIVERMWALEGLHKQASEFSKSLTELETLQQSIASGVQYNKDLLQGVQEVFAHNVDTIQKEIKKMEERIIKLASELPKETSSKD